MIDFKSKGEVETMKEGGRRLKEVVKELIAKIKQGMTTKQIDNEAERLIRKIGGEPSFKRVKGYHWSTCLPINEQIVHTPPSARILQEGDILTIDIGMYYKGFHTDFADTIAIGKVEKKITDFLQTGKQALWLAIGKVKRGNRLGEVSLTIQREIEKQGYSIVKELTGHGVGKELHEDPYIRGFLDSSLENTPIIKPGLVVAIEVIYAMGSGQMIQEKHDNWSIQTADGSLSACFEHTVAATDTNTLILT